MLKNRELLIQLTLRELQNRYRGSFFGVFWSLLTPLFMLVIYTFVFGFIFKSRWGSEVTDQYQFALILFCGLSVFQIFSEVVSRAPGIVVNNPNYVKRVVFPVEVLTLSLLGSSVIHGGISLAILIVSTLILEGHLHLTIIYLPIVLLPLLLLTAGVAWFLASLGVFIRDVNQIIPVLLSAMMFLSPIFYPISIIPEKLRFLYYLNPISYVVEDIRQILIWGNTPNWQWYLICLAIGIITATLGYLWFQKTKKGFADVI